MGHHHPVRDQKRSEISTSPPKTQIIDALASCLQEAVRERSALVASRRKLKAPKRQKLIFFYWHFSETCPFKVAYCTDFNEPNGLSPHSDPTVKSVSRRCSGEILLFGPLFY
jgi:hypothetical protein